MKIMMQMEAPMPLSMAVVMPEAKAYMVSSMTLRYSVEVVTNKTMQKETMQSVKFSIGTFHGQANICKTIMVVKIMAMQTT